MSVDDVTVTITPEDTIKITVDEPPDITIAIDSPPEVIILASGNTGVRGPEGPPGVTGGSGPQGEPGAEGPMGPTGVKGDTGETGPPGNTGATGPQGPQGVKGDVGPSGGVPPGGAIGQVLAKETVTDYDTEWIDVVASGGATDLEYLGAWQAGIEYSDGDVVIYNGTPYMATKTTTEAPVQWNVPGAGPTGPQGPPGPQGNIGPQGIKGDTGSQGIKGDTGAQGPQGSQGVQGPQGIPGVVTAFREGHTFAVAGDLSVLPSALPSIFVPMSATQTTVLRSVRAKLGSGTSVGVQVKRNGSNVGTVITVTPTVNETSLGNIALANNDELSFSLSALTGTPVTLTLTFVLETTAT